MLSMNDLHVLHSSVCASVMAAWTDKETLKLIEVWSEDRIQEELEGCRKNRQVFEKIVEKLKSAGFERTVEQCRVKVKKLKGDYRKIKDTHSKTGSDRKAWKYFDAMDTILGAKPATQPAVVVDTLEDEDNVLQG